MHLSPVTCHLSPVTSTHLVHVEEAASELVGGVASSPGLALSPGRIKVK